MEREIAEIKLSIDLTGNQKIVAVKLLIPRITKNFELKDIESAHEVAREIDNDVTYFYTDSHKHKIKVCVVNKSNSKKAYLRTEGNVSRNDGLLKLPHFQ
ncbi:DUF3892 domain-containing protein [Oenococcus sp. UCMA 17063]|nr:DUF3892 domain-containing protein [Oenococcus sp. UCMA 17063]